MKQHNILITSAGKRVVLTRAFKDTLAKYDSKAKVYTTDMNPEMAPAGYVSDECIQVPRCTADNYVELLLQICKEKSIGLIIPTIDTELLILAINRLKFEELGVVVSVPSMVFVAICRDKRNTGQFLEAHGIRIPAEVDKYNPVFPLFAKPYDGSLSANLHYITKPEELTDDILNDPKLLFMEYIDKKVYKEYTVDMYYGADNELKCLVPRERIEIRAGEINKGCTHKGKLMEYLKKRMSHIEGCVGCICLQVFYNPETEDVVGIEINPRFGGGYPQSYAAGANFPELLIREYFGKEKIEYFEDWKDNLIMLRYDDAIFVG